jgi:hypothetical protein
VTTARSRAVAAPADHRRNSPIDASVRRPRGRPPRAGTVRVLVTTLVGESRATWQGSAGPTVDDALETLAGGVEAALGEIDVGWDQVRAVGVGVPA